MKIAVIGGGNMGGAIATAAVSQGLAATSEIIVSHPKQGFPLPPSIRTTRDNISAITQAELIVLSVKPWHMEQVLRQLAPHIDASRQVIVSVAAGVTFAQMASYLSTPTPALFRVIPNTALAVGSSVTFLAARGATPAQHAAVLQLFNAMGTTFQVDEQEIHIGMALASCGIAYALRYIDAAARGGVALGMEYGQSQRIVMETLQGALALLRTNGTTPQVEIDKVTTPGGITLRGLEAMEAGGFSAAVITGLEKSKE